MTKKILLLLIILISTTLLKAQVKDSIKDDDEEKTTNLKASVEYMNKAAFSGRDYLINSGLISPSVSYNLKSGFSFGFTAYIMPNDTSKTRQFELAASYNKDLFDWWNIEGGLTIYRTSVNITNKLNKAKVQTQTDYGLSIINTFDFDWMFIYNATYYFFGTEKGLNIITMIGKDIEIDKLTGIEDLTISPTLTAEQGNHFAKFRQLKKKLLSTAPISTKFQPLDYEISLPIEYDLKAFTFNFTPSYSFPVNILAQESNLGNNFFYFTAKLTYQLDF